MDGDVGEGSESLFGRLYTYEECQRAQRDTRKEPATPRPIERPAHWPVDTDVDTGRWVFWLPEGWGQGIKVTHSGKTLKCFIGPTGKRLFHKKDIEKELGYVLPEKPPPAPKDDDGRPVQSLDEAVPLWPGADKGEDWLPRDWRVCFRKLPSRLHRVFVPPNQNTGFFYHREQVEKYLSGEDVTMSPFGSSRAMAEISANAQTPRKGAERRHAKKSRDESMRIVQESDYQPNHLFAFAKAEPSDALAARLADVGVPEPSRLAENCAELQQFLTRQGFPKSTELLVAFVRESTEPPSRVVQLLCGVYFRLSDSYAERPCYQKLCQPAEPSCKRVACVGLYIFWSETRRSWKLGALDDGKAGFAISTSEGQTPADAAGPWRLLREDACGLAAAEPTSQ